MERMCLCLIIVSSKKIAYSINQNINNLYNLLGVYKPKTEDRRPKTKDRKVLKRFF